MNIQIPKALLFSLFFSFIQVSGSPAFAGTKSSDLIMTKRSSLSHHLTRILCLLSTVSARIPLVEDGIFTDGVRGPGRNLLSLSSVCAALDTLDSQVDKVCNYEVSYPDGAKIIQCKNKFLAHETCKTKKTYSLACPTLAKPHRKCTSSVCIPGLEEAWYEFPCGIDILYKRQSICDSNHAHSAVERSEKVCKCLSILKDVDLGSTSNLSYLSDTKIAQMSQGIKCGLNKAFNVQDNSREVKQDLYAGDDFVIALPEIDLAMYLEASAQIVRCISLGDCVGLSRVFTTYVKESSDIVVKEVMDEVQEYFDIIRLTKGLVQVLSGQVNSNIEALKSIEDCGDYKNTPEYIKFKTTLEQVKDIGYRLTQIDIEKIRSDINLLVAFFELVASTDSVDSLIETLTDARLEKIMEVVLRFDKIVKLVEELVAVKDTIQIAFSQDANFITDFPDAIEYIRNNPCLNEKIPHDADDFQRIFGSVEAFAARFSNLPKEFDFRMGVASYQRWAQVSANMPCQEQGEKCYLGSGERKCVEYPKFYSCRQETVIPFPNEHIPYLRIKGGFLGSRAESEGNSFGIASTDGNSYAPPSTPASAPEPLLASEEEGVEERASGSQRPKPISEDEFMAGPKVETAQVEAESPGPDYSDDNGDDSVDDNSVRETERQSRDSSSVHNENGKWAWLVAAPVLASALLQ